MLPEQLGYSERRACGAVGLSRSVAHHERQPDRNDAVIAVLRELAERFPERVFDNLFLMIRRRGLNWNHKRLYRMYCELRLNRRRRGKKRIPSWHPQPLAMGASVNACWSACRAHLIKSTHNWRFLGFETGGRRQV